MTSPTHSTRVKAKPTPAGPKKLLALDGGGIRGLITVEILAQLEQQLQQQLGRDDRFVLADYFDYIAGTSTGAIIATCLALEMRVSAIREFYVGQAKPMFSKAGLWARLHYQYHDEPLARTLREVLGKEEAEGDGKKSPQEVTLGSARLKTLLMIVLRNATTDSPWPVSNNPQAKYNDRRRPDCNLALPLWQLVRASTAAPVYFPPEIVKLGPKEFIFVDGGITPYNNPAFQLFLMATVNAYRLQWPVGEDQLLLVSIGTGLAPEAEADLRTSQMHLLYQAKSLPSALMYAINTEQDRLCRIFGRCRAGGPLDREIESLMGEGSLILGSESQGLPKHFTYLRYNAELTRAGLDVLGLSEIRPEDVQPLDVVDQLSALQAIGQAVGEQQITMEDFQPFLSQESP